MFRSKAVLVFKSLEVHARYKSALQRHPCAAPLHTIIEMLDRLQCGPPVLTHMTSTNTLRSVILHHVETLMIFQKKAVDLKPENYTEEALRPLFDEEVAQAKKAKILFKLVGRSP